MCPCRQVASTTLRMETDLTGELPLDLGMQLIVHLAPANEIRLVLRRRDHLLVSVDRRERRTDAVVDLRRPRTVVVKLPRSASEGLPSATLGVGQSRLR